MIADEVIMGLGRTGAPFAIQHWGVEPDIITTAKVPPSSFPFPFLLTADSC